MNKLIDAFKTFMTFSKPIRHLILVGCVSLVLGIFLAQFIPLKYTSIFGFAVIPDEDYQNAQKILKDNISASSELKVELKNMNDKYQKLVSANCTFFEKQAAEANVTIDTEKNLVHMAALNHQDDMRQIAEKNFDEASNRYRSIVDKIGPCFVK